MEETVTEVNWKLLQQMQRLNPKKKQAEIKRGPNKEIIYGCLECPMQYNDIETLELHLCMHNNEYRYLCNLCGAGLKRREHLERHKLEHYERRPHPCPVCGKAFKRKEHLTIHKTTHSTEKSEVCPICLRSFHRKDHLQKHLTVHNKINFPPFSLSDDVKSEPLETDSDTTSDSQAVFQSSDPLRPFACYICMKTYKRKDHLKLHSLTHLKKDKVCGECGKGFHSEIELSMHLELHLKVENNSSSEDDQRIIDETLLVPIHMETKGKKKASKSEDRPHECGICHKRFKRKQHLRVHGYTHSKEASYCCPMCNYTFNNKYEHDVHICQPLNGENIPEDNSNLNIKIEHDDEIIPMDLLPQGYAPPWIREPPAKFWVCNDCGKAFRRKDHYNIHLNIHTGIKKFSCPDCGKGFYRKDHLQKHSQIHNRVKKKPVRPIPDLRPINTEKKPPTNNILPEITIHAPSNSKLRVPLQIKVPYQVVTPAANGGTHSVTIHPIS